MTTIEHYSAATIQKSIGYWGLRSYRIVLDTIQWHALVWNFFRRNLLSRFHGSLLGAFWVLVQPLFLFCVYFAIFGILYAPRLADGGPDVGFAIYLFAGIVAFSAIGEATSNALSAVVGNANLVKKVKFPCEFLPLVPALVAMCVYVVGCVVLVLAGLIAGEVHLTWKLLLWPVLLLIQFGFVLGIGMLLASVNVFVRDVAHLYRILMTAWFLLSPNFWTFHQIQGKFAVVGADWLDDVLMLNPACPLLLAQRQVFGIGDGWDPQVRAETFPLSLGGNLLLGAAWAGLFVFFGYGFFKSRRHKFADLV